MDKLYIILVFYFIFTNTIIISFKHKIEKTKKLTNKIKFTFNYITLNERITIFK